MKPAKCSEWKVCARFALPYHVLAEAKRDYDESCAILL